jgi:hypothetical protein
MEDFRIMIDRSDPETLEMVKKSTKLIEICNHNIAIAGVDKEGDMLSFRINTRLDLGTLFAYMEELSSINPVFVVKAFQDSPVKPFNLCIFITFVLNCFKKFNIEVDKDKIEEYVLFLKTSMAE